MAKEDGDEEEEVAESNSPSKGRKKKRAASIDPEDNPLGWFGFRCRTHPQEASQGEAPGRIVSIQRYYTYIWPFTNCRITCHLRISVWPVISLKYHLQGICWSQGWQSAYSSLVIHFLIFSTPDSAPVLLSGWDSHSHPARGGCRTPIASSLVSLMRGTWGSPAALFSGACGPGFFVIGLLMLHVTPGVVTTPSVGRCFQRLRVQGCVGGPPVGVAATAFRRLG